MGGRGVGLAGEGGWQGHNLTVSTVHKELSCSPCPDRGSGDGQIHPLFALVSPLPALPCALRRGRGRTRHRRSPQGGGVPGLCGTRSAWGRKTVPKGVRCLGQGRVSHLPCVTAAPR